MDNEQLQAVPSSHIIHDEPIRNHYEYAFPFAAMMHYLKIMHQLSFHIYITHQS